MKSANRTVHPRRATKQAKAEASNGHDVLTLDEAAKFLRLSRDTVLRQADNGTIPGRKVERTWRFLRSALEEWLRGAEKPGILTSFGAFKDDETLPEVIKEVYRRRGRPEVETGAER